MRRKGFAFIFTMLLIVVLLTLGSASFTRTANDSLSARVYADSGKAFWVAEAGVNYGLVELRDNFNQAEGTGVWTGQIGEGEFSIDLSAISGAQRTMTAYGYIPSIADPQLVRVIEVEVSQSIPANFYDNTVYSADDVTINGNSFDLDAKDNNPAESAILYADNCDVQHPENVTGTSTQDPNVDPLARFDFEELYAQAASQGNVYSEARLQEVTKGNDSFPADFWYETPTDPSDPSTGTPNVVYVETDLKVNGNIGTIGGFFVVVGDVITDPDVTEDVAIVGCGTILGAVYTLGELNVNGGGATGLAIDGGVWAGEGVTINGSADLTYNEDYMVAIESLGVNPEARILTWREVTNPYPRD